VVRLPRTLIEWLVAASLVVLIGFFVVCGGLDILIQVPLLVLFGWPFYLARVVPQIEPHPAEVALAAGSLLVVVFGTHRLCRWLYAATNPPAVWPWRWTLRAVGVVVLMFVCGTAMVGVTHQLGWLATSPEPILKRSGGIREAVARASSQGSLKQLGLAAINFNDAENRMPAPTFTPDGRPLHSWHTHLLPYVEQDALYRKIRHDLPWDHPDNAEWVRTPIKVFHSPYVALDLPDGLGLTGFGPNARLFDRPRRLGNETDFPAGTSNTLLAGEAVQHPKPWGDPLNWRDPQLGLNRHPDGFSGSDARGCNVVMADGSVRFVTPAGWDQLLRGEPPD
jgi:prepilin-type processing-associated H-X9-DG protein